MFSHVFFGVSDFKRSLDFYTCLMDTLGISQRFCDLKRPWAAWQSAPGPRPLFVIAKPHNNAPHHAGNGQMVAFLARNRETVRLAYKKAMDMGATSEGLPGLRLEYHPDYYGAYFRDLDGNKICIVCHEVEA